MKRVDTRVTLQEYTEVDDPLGTVREWQDVETYWAKKIYISIDGRAKFEQIGHSNIDFYLRFNYRLDLELSKHRFKIDGKIYEVISPPEHRQAISRVITKIAVKEVAGDV